MAMQATSQDEKISELWDKSLKSAQARRVAMPSLNATLAVLWEAYQRLREMGFNDGIYCPKDGSEFEVVQIGSTGIFKCTYSGEWPDGHAMVQDGHDIYPQHPGGLLWRKPKGQER